MNKEKLIQRLSEVDIAINNHNQQIQQFVSNLNLLIGSKNELLHWISECDKPLEPEEDKTDLECEEKAA